MTSQTDLYQDTQQETLGFWQEFEFAFFDWIEAEEIQPLVTQLGKRFLPNIPIPSIRIVEDADAGIPDGAMACYWDKPYEIVFGKQGDQNAMWPEWAVLHEFAHALTCRYYGEHWEGIESHGPEFLGVYCYVAAEHWNLDQAELLASAKESGLQVKPFDPAKWKESKDG